ncbi:4Fe-4S dicluster domain-containing protein [Phocaeicola sp.]
MLELNKGKLLYTFEQCQQCGICSAVCPENAISLSLRKDGLHDIEIGTERCIACGKCVKSCPANKEYNYEGYFDGFEQKKYFLGYHADNRIRRESSSGGICKTLIIDSLKNSVVDGVYSLRCTDSFPFARGEFYTRENLPSFGDMPNSVYHSVMACTEIGRIQPCKRLMLVGTACQLRALNSVIKGKCDEIIRVCIFCKQQKTLDSTRFLAKVMGTSVPQNLRFRPRYRGDGWPGIVRVDESELPWNRAAQIPFGKRLWTVPGCNVCGDSFGIEAGADISLMDPWCIRPHNDLGETLVTVHTPEGGRLLQRCASLILKPQSFSEVEPALSLKDVWRKQVTEPVFRGKPYKERYVRAVRAELNQQRLLRMVVEKLPRLPIICYRILAKLPDLRNLILK